MNGTTQEQRARIGEALQGVRGEDQKRIAEVGLQVIDLLLRKNRDYGSSAWTPPVLCPGTSIRDAIAVRMSDEVARIAKLNGGPAEVAESLEDTVRDLAGYAILWIGAEAKGDIVSPGLNPVPGETAIDALDRLAREREQWGAKR